jgi:hypothetical protein
MRTECLLEAGPDCRVRVQVRCLQVVRRTDPGGPAWQEAQERTAAELELPAGELAARPHRAAIELPAGASTAGGVGREWREVRGQVTVATEPAADGVLRVSVQVENTTPAPPGVDREEAQLRALVSTHVVLRVADGRFVSLTDPPPALREAAAGCANRGAWPVLVGPPGSRDTLLASPIILEDYPRVAAESPGDLFDATEIDEILTLRILTLTDEEKAELRRTDERARRLLERTESLTPDELQRLHGKLSPELHVGDAVRLHPRPGADVFDLALRGRTARVESIERDLEDQVHVAVVLDDDPGADLGLMRMPGHRFFFRLSEVEPL